MTHFFFHGASGRKAIYLTEDQMLGKDDVMSSLEGSEASSPENVLSPPEYLRKRMRRYNPRPAPLFDRSPK